MQINLFGEEEKTLTDKYTHKCSAPQYLPKAEAPQLEELVNVANYRKLVADINRADIPEDLRDFLKLAATRHLVFNYDKIADYYASATPEVQRLMEQSALVIIDVNDAIMLGYIKLSKTVKDIIEASKDEE